MNKKGVTLTEVIIAAFIITLLSAGMLGSFIGARQFLNRVRHRMQALNFAREALDRLRSNYTYRAAPEMDTGSHDASGIGASIRGELANFIAAVPKPFTYDVSAEPQPDSYKAVTVTVTWKEPWEP